MPRGRPFNPDLVAKRKLSLPATLIGRVELELPFDAARRKPKYGALNGLIGQLLEEWLQKRTGEPTYVDTGE